MIKKLIGKPVSVGDDRWLLTGETDDGRRVEVIIANAAMETRGFKEPSLAAANEVPALSLRIIRGD